MPKWLKTLVDATRVGDDEVIRPGPEDYVDPVQFDADTYAEQVYRKDDASLGMPEVDIAEEAEWSFEGEVYDQHTVEEMGLHIRHDEGIASARRAGVALRQCFACRIDLRKPHVEPSNLALLTSVFPAQRWLRDRWFWHLGFDHYESIRDYGTRAITVFLATRRLTETTYPGPGLTKPPTVMRLQHYPLHLINTPSWITDERTTSPGAEL